MHNLYGVFFLYVYHPCALCSLASPCGSTCMAANPMCSMTVTSFGASRTCNTIECRMSCMLSYSTDDTLAILFVRRSNFNGLELTVDHKNSQHFICARWFYLRRLCFFFSPHIRAMRNSWRSFSFRDVASNEWQIYDGIRNIFLSNGSEYDALVFIEIWYSK